MKKKGRPALGERRKLTRNEVQISGLKHGTEVSNENNVITLHTKESIYMWKEFEKLQEFWHRDTSGKCGKL